ncbi:MULTISPECIES: ABC transporter substrate-binding protein [Pseudomonas]|uniref:ABC transporter substrate-binding protein n=1 Tax=Pseudomonas phytophila TaxID=2867264 RepID=A0ABY6FJE2_9PSED|nr:MULTISPECIES: ABC transporter substrate-binding protein [Pseudomonas]MCD5988053.1 ABC transporter substrate-binding protein [Pseudomonas quasicaspiana]MDU8359626.1 ABC transporter substrate-binding protein [Pseudomonas syringae group sp. J309-1]UXZ97891.1 ABC transporter substrate-binding protein [Pseudomonas phytophila]
MMKKVLLTLMGLMAATTVMADGLQDVKDRGTLRCATLTDSVPLGYQDPTTREIVGLDVDLCKALAKHLGVKAELQGVAVSARIPTLISGRADVVAAALGYTKERAEQIDFSSAYYQVPIKVLVKGDSGIKTFADLADKRVSAIKSSTPELYARQQITDAKVVGFEDAPSAFLALQQGKVQGMAMTEPASIRFHTRSQNMRFLDQALHFEPNCVGVKKGETALTNAINQALVDMEASGELQALWDHWYGDQTEYKLVREKKLTALSDFQ